MRNSRAVLLQDYKQRALNFQGKEKRLKALTRRAAERNPDEFYFKMTGAKTTVRWQSSWRQFCLPVAAH